jgi:MinD-like ATPase involved in chromosome partitioning or flagellar assembly
MAIKRIIPISSGKGGVGKTTFAVNFSLALSRFGRTILVDLDTGTSAIRNAIDVPIARDLYHFFRRGEPLTNCITMLDDRIDPQRRYRNFGFVAGPLHLIEEITNFGADYKRRLMEAINSLRTDFVVLDLRAGLDSSVIEFLPFSNSGLLIFTPHLPAATLAASDIVKAILFRKLRLIFSRDSPFFQTVERQLDFFRLTNELIDRVEDVYDSSVPNLDAFSADLFASLGNHPITRVVQNTLDEFRVYYVLNLFNGVEDSFNTAVRPFIENLTGMSRLTAESPTWDGSPAATPFIGPTATACRPCWSGARMNGAPRPPTDTPASLTTCDWLPSVSSRRRGKRSGRSTSSSNPRIPPIICRTSSTR